MRYGVHWFSVMTLMMSALAATHAPVKAHLSLSDAVLLSVRSNPSVRSTKLQWVVDRYAYAVSRYAFEPQLSLSAEGSLTHGERRSGALTPSMQWHFTQGATLDVSEDTSTHTATFAVTQPLLRGFGKVAATSLRNAEDQLSVAHLQVKQTLIDTINRTLSAYWTLLAAKEALKVQEASHRQAHQLYEQYKVKVDIGELAASSLMQQSAQVLQSKLEVSKQKTTVIERMQDLMLALGLEPSASVTIDPKLSDVHSFKLWPLKQSLTYAIRHNISYQQALINQEVLVRSERQARDQRRWSLDFSGSVDTKGERSATLSLSVPIHDKSRYQTWLNAKVAMDQGAIQLMQTRQKLEAEIASEWYNCQAQLEQIALTEKKVALSQANYEIAVKKKLVGRASAYEVVQQQQAMVQDALSLIELKVSYLSALSRFHGMLGLTLPIWGIHVAS